MIYIIIYVIVSIATALFVNFLLISECDEKDLYELYGKRSGIIIKLVCAILGLFWFIYIPYLIYHSTIKG